MTELEVLEQELLKPTDALINDIAKIDGDIILFGVVKSHGFILSLSDRCHKREHFNHMIVTFCASCCF